MSAWKRVVALMGIYLCSLLVVAVPASAQISGAAVSMTCAPGQIQVEVKPGATLTGYTTCTVSNPTAYVEKVAITVTSDGLATAAPGDMYVGAGQDVDFQVVVRANPYMQMQSRQLTVSAQVQELNNLPPPNTAPETARIMVRTPKNQGWSDAYHVLEFYAESEFACQNGGCNRESQMITVYVRGVYLPGFEVVPALSMIALAGAVAGRRFLNTEDEADDEWREAAPGL